MITRILDVRLGWRRADLCSGYKARALAGAYALRRHSHLHPPSRGLPPLILSVKPSPSASSTALLVRAQHFTLLLPGYGGLPTCYPKVLLSVKFALEWSDLERRATSLWQPGRWVHMRLDVRASRILKMPPDFRRGWDARGTAAGGQRRWWYVSALQIGPRGMSLTRPYPLRLDPSGRHPDGDAPDRR